MGFGDNADTVAEHNMFGSSEIILCPHAVREKRMPQYGLAGGVMLRPNWSQRSYCIARTSSREMCKRRLCGRQDDIGLHRSIEKNWI